MAGKLFNVRLSEIDAAKASSLQRAGVAISDLVREAIRAAHAKQLNGRRRRRSRAMLEEIFDEVPQPPDAPPHTVRSHVRREFQAYMTAYLTGKHHACAALARRQRADRPQRTTRRTV